MKLIFAGTGTSALDYGQFLFNCKRNKNCQRAYYVPIRGINDLTFYIDLPGKPDLFESTLFDTCHTERVPTDGEYSDEHSDEFYIVSPPIISTGQVALMWNKYIIGQKPDGTWYAVFSMPYSLDPIIADCFFIQFKFSYIGLDYIYYSEQFCIEKCDNLAFLQGCYPNEKPPAKAYDCNGIYYGFHAGIDQPLGTSNFRYFHWAYVRKASIIDSKASFKFTYFNSKRNYKTQLSREKVFEFELVPDFYKNHLLGIFARGNVRIDGYEYRLAEEQNWSVLSFDSKLWQLDTNLIDECKNVFGCGPADCQLPIEDCENPPTDISFEVSEEAIWTILFSGGTFSLGDSIEWELIDSENNPYLNGTVTTLPLSFTVNGFEHEDFNLATKCFKLRWRKVCAFGGATDWSETTIGECEKPAGTEGTIAMFSYGGGREGSGQQCSAQGATKLRFRFPTPTVAAMTLHFAYVYNAGGPWTGSGNEILDPSHPDYADAGSRSVVSFEVNIPIGSTDYLTPILTNPLPGFPGVTDDMISFPICNPAFGALFTSKLFYVVDSPGGTVLNLTPVFDTPAPWSVRNNAFTAVQII